MRSKRTSPQEQLRLITECHQSGLTDYEWCQQHNIKVSTFYAWVHRLKRSGEIDIPAVIPTVVRKEPGAARYCENQDRRRKANYHHTEVCPHTGAASGNTPLNADSAGISGHGSYHS